MSHAVHKVRAYILASRNVGEANKHYTLFTEDHGLIVATAQSVRLEKSKLRFTLQPYSFAEVLLVYGRGGWRITNALLIENFFFGENTEIRRVVVNITHMLKRLIVGEERDSRLFSVVTEGLLSLQKRQNDEMIPLIEIALVSHILHILGYGTDSGILEDVTGKTNSADLFDFLKREKHSIVKEINTALTSTGL